MKYVNITLLQSAQSILTQFSGSLQQRALANFQSSGVDVRLGVAVTKVTRDEMTIKVKGEEVEEVVPYGICVWSTGELKPCMGISTLTVRLQWVSYSCEAQLSNLTWGQSKC